MNRPDGLPRTPAAHRVCARVYEKDPEGVESAIEELLTEAEESGEQYRVRGLLDLQRQLKNGSLVETPTPKKTHAKKATKRKPAKKKTAPAAAVETS